MFGESLQCGKGLVNWSYKKVRKVRVKKHLRTIKNKERIQKLFKFPKLYKTEANIIYFLFFVLSLFDSLLLFIISKLLFLLFALLSALPTSALGLTFSSTLPLYFARSLSIRFNGPIQFVANFSDLSQSNYPKFSIAPFPLTI